MGRRQDGYGGITIGIIGLGRIGSRLADLLAPWRVRIIAYDPYQKDQQFILHDVERAELNDLLEQSDVVTLHTNLTSETKGFMDATKFLRMKDSAYLLNASRGAVIDENALIKALDLGQIAGAAIDVFEEEPLPRDNRLRDFKQNIFGTHNGSNTLEGVDKVSIKVLDIMKSYIRK